MTLEKAEFFMRDYAKQFAWFVDEAGENVARRFQTALDQALNQLLRQPDLGRFSRKSNQKT